MRLKMLLAAGVLAALAMTAADAAPIVLKASGTPVIIDAKPGATQEFTFTSAQGCSAFGWADTSGTVRSIDVVAEVDGASQKGKAGAQGFARTSGVGGKVGKITVSGATRLAVLYRTYKPITWLPGAPASC